MDLDLRLLRHAHTLADLGSFARAAKALGITQPALSRSIKTLESRVGARLFERSATGVGLTDSGQLFLQHAQELLTCADQLAHQVEFLRGIDAGAVAVGSGPYPSELVVAQSVGRTSQKAPGRFRLVVSDPVSIVALLGRRELDLAIVETSIVPAGAEWSVEPLNRHQGYFVVRRGHPLTRVRAPTIPQILAFPLVMTSRLPPRILRPLLERHPRLNDTLKALPTIAVESPAMMRAIVGTSDAVAPLPLGLVADELAGGTLVALDRAEPWLHLQFGIVRLRRDGLPPAALTFLEVLHEVDDEVLRLETRLAKAFVGSRTARKAPARKGGQA
jgi:DNA-binding transcriptional LysR family regulator